MNERIEEKNYIKDSQIYDLKQWIAKNNGFEIYSKRNINSIYFDNYKSNNV